MFTQLLGCTATSRATRDAAELVAARQLTLRGMDAVQQNDYEAAEELFREAVAASPHDERAHLEYARILWHGGEQRDAISHMKEAVRLSGDAPELLVELGRMQFAMGNLNAARDSGLEAARTDMQCAAAHALVGDVLAQQGRLDQALESYHLALSLDARQPTVLLAVAEIYRTWDEPRRMLSSLQRIEVSTLPPTLAARTCYLRGIAENRLGRHQDAADNLAQAARLLPSVNVLFELASAHQQLGNIDAAKQALETALQYDPNHRPTRDQLAKLNSMPGLATGGTVRR